MNKYIKHKKKAKLEYIKLFTKTERLFLNNFPRLYPICSVNNISYNTVNNAWKRVKRLNLITKEEFEIMQKTLIVAKQENYTYRTGSRGDYYKRIFEKAGIKY